MKLTTFPYSTSKRVFIVFSLITWKYESRFLEGTCDRDYLF